VLHRFLDKPAVERPHLAAGPAGEVADPRHKVEQQSREKQRQAS